MCNVHVRRCQPCEENKYASPDPYQTEKNKPLKMIKYMEFNHISKQVGQQKLNETKAALKKLKAARAERHSSQQRRSLCSDGGRSL